MDSESIAMAPELWSELPCGIQEHLLTFLTVPVQCRFQTVCKRWDSVIRTASFRKLSIKHANPRAYIMGRVCRSRLPCHGRGQMLSDSLGWRLLDVDANRWYWIKPPPNCADRSGRQARHRRKRYEKPTYEPRSLSMDGGFAFALTAYTRSQLQGASALMCMISHPVAGLAIEFLPDSPYSSYTPALDFRSMLVPFLTSMVVEHGETATRYKIYLMSCKVHELGPISLAVYDSTAYSWRRSAANLAEQMNVRDDPSTKVKMVRCIAVFQGFLYAVLTNPYDYDFVDGIWDLWRYSPEQDAWTKLSRARRILDNLSWFHVIYPQLVVSGDRLFLAMWVVQDYLITFDVLEILPTTIFDAPDRRCWRLLFRERKSQMETAFETEFFVSPEAPPRNIWNYWPRKDSGCEAVQYFAVKSIFAWFGKVNGFADSPNVAAIGLEKSIVLIAKQTGISREIDLETRLFKSAETQPFAQAPSCEHDVWYGQPMNAIMPHYISKY